MIWYADQMKRVLRYIDVGKIDILNAYVISSRMHITKYMSKRPQTNYKKRIATSESNSSEEAAVKYYVKKQRAKSAKKKLCLDSSESEQKSKRKRPAMKSTKIEPVESSEDETTRSDTEYDFETETEVDTESVEDVPVKSTRKSLLVNNKVTVDDTGRGTDITDTCYEDIDDTYSKAKYLDLDVAVLT